jgi:dihydropteroate synthase
LLPGCAFAYRGGVLPSGRTAVMGILNVTRDSFWDGGRYDTLGAALARADAIAREGADLLDVGAESTRPGAARVDAALQRDRLVPLIEALTRTGYPLPISVDTTLAAVAKAALDAGAALVNDVSGGADDPDILDVVAREGAGIVLMHMRGTPATMSTLTSYGDVVEDVREALRRACDTAGAHGVPADRQCVDPGIGFAKDARQSTTLIQRIAELAPLARPVLLGASRKSFLGKQFGLDDDERLWGSLAVAAWAARQGVAIVRVHDVRATRATLDVLAGLEGGGA